MKNNLIICYGSDNVTLNWNNQHIILTNKDAGFLLKSLINNLTIIDISIK